MDAKIKTGGQLIVDCLRVNDVERIFCVPGESFLPVLDALYDVPDIDLIVFSPVSLVKKFRYYYYFLLLSILVPEYFENV